MAINPQELFFLLSDDTRYRVAMLLHGQGELCVCELVAALDIIQPKVSRHLAVLRDSGVVMDRRDGTRVFYRLADRLPKWARETIGGAYSQERRIGAHKADIARLRAMAGRPVRREFA